MKKTVCFFVILSFLLCSAFPAAAAKTEQTSCRCVAHQYHGALPYVPGDLNLDERIDAYDALNLLKLCVTAAVTSVPMPAVRKGLCCAAPETVDVNNDQKVNAADALAILQYAVGKRDRFERQPTWPVAFEEYHEHIFSLTAAIMANSCTVSYTIYPVAWDPAMFSIYCAGPDYAAYLLEEVLHGSLSDCDGVHAYVPFYMIASILHLYIPVHFRYYHGEHNEWIDVWEGDDTDCMAEQMLTFMQTVPERVEAICSDETMTLEEQVKALHYYGMLALPYLADRIAMGQTQWEVCFENQLLGLGIQERYNAMSIVYTDNKYFEEDGRDYIFEAWTAAAKPLCVSRWIETHAALLQSLRRWCQPYTASGV